MKRDSGGNLLITSKGRKAKRSLLAVAHMDHPAFVITQTERRGASFEFRGGVTAPYFVDARVAVVSRPDGAEAVVVAYDDETMSGTLEITRSGSIEPGDIAMWKMRRHRVSKDRFLAPACDDLAGVAAALAALDRCRRDPALAHFGVLLTRAEEVGLLGAIHAAKHRTVPDDSRILSIETSRELPNARIGNGPVIRTGDRVTVFDRELTNRISRGVVAAGIPHQRRLMDGGGCEATAFGAYGYQASGLCLCLGNWHNRGNFDEVELGVGDPKPMLEEISLADFHGLIDLLVLSASAVDISDPIKDRLEDGYRSSLRYLG